MKSGQVLGLTLWAVAACLGVSASASAATGRTAGNFSVSPTGAATYTIPIWAAPGPNGLQPNLSLSYNSHLTGGGIMGPGWRLSGLSSISRCSLTLAQDGAPATVSLTSKDAFCLDGSRLRLTSSETLSTYGQDGTTYQTEIANFSNVTAHGAAGVGPASFTVQHPDGATYEYGVGGNSQVLATGSTTAVSWMLDKITDRAGNTLTITYTAPGATLTGTTVPATISWTPSSAGSTSYNYTMTFVYTNNVPASSLSGYVAGTTVVNQDLLLNIVIANSAGATIKDYFLGYDTSPTTGAYRLTQIKECADSGASNCLLPTSITYQNGSAGLGSAQTLVSSQSAAPSQTYTAYDFNGDGRTDLAWYAIGGHWMVSLATAGGYGAPIDTGISASYVMLGNARGTSTDGLLADVGGNLLYYEWNGSSFTASPTGITVTGQFAFADVNGDGRPDLVTIGSDNYVYLSINSSTQGSISFGPAIRTIANDNLVIHSNYRSSRHLQFFGAGQDDLWGGNTSGMTILHYNGTTFVESLYGQGAQDFADFNDDGCTDVLGNSGIYVSGCNGTPGGVIPTTSFSPVALIDWDGNGRKDILTPGNGITCSVYLSTGNSFNSNPVATNIPSTLATGAQFSTIPNAAGDGLDGLAVFQNTSPYAIQYYLHNGVAQPPDLAVSFTDGYGINYSPSYQSITLGSYTKGNTATYPEMDIATPVYVVSQVTQSDGIGGTYSQTHTYAGARQNLQGYGFEGFATHKITDSRNNSLVHQLDYNQSFPLTGTLGDEATYQHDGVTPVSKALYEIADKVLDSTVGNQRHFPTLQLKEQLTYDVGGSLNGTETSKTTTTYTWDNYGNATNVSASTMDEDPNSPYAYQSWTTTTVTTVSADTSSNWCLNIPTEIRVYKYSPGSGSSIMRTTSYDSPADTIHCRINHKNIEPGNPTYAVTHAYLYDSFGNISDDMVTGVGMATRITHTNWGMSGQFPASVENPLLQTTLYGYDPNFGVRTSVTDPNGLTTSWSIDSFGRKTRETRIDGTATTWAYNDCASSTCLFGNHALVIAQAVLNADLSTQTDGTTYFDQLDRPVVTTKRLLASGSYDRNETHYDNFGRTVQQAIPCVWSGVTASCPYMVSNTYDAIGRPLQTARPTSATDSSPDPLSFAYSGRTTVITDLNGKQSIRVADVAGELVRSTDANGYSQNFIYDGFGSLLSVTDSSSNNLFAATYDYGIDAFQRNATDMDLDVSTAAGQHRQYTYDALGELTNWTDAKGQSFSQTYDALSRPLSRTEPDLTTSWVWGAASASDNIGRLQSATASSTAGNYSQAYSYDTKGRMAARSITIPSDGTYTYSYAYNTTSGLLDSLTYPVSTNSYQLKLHYAYQNGTLQSVSDANAGTVFWNATAADARNQVTSETLGNGVVTTRALDAVTGLPTQILSGVGSGNGLQNDSYLFDALGNLTQRQNNNAGLTESFYYDSLYRLDHSQLGGSANLQMHYDATGNITSKSDVGAGVSWTYDPNRKHAVSSAGSYTYTYDSNGNATTRGNQTITWTSYNHPLQISGGGESVQFAYDQDHTRWESVYSGPTGIETTYFIGDLLEKVVTAGPTSEFRHYIYAGQTKVAVYSRSNSGTALRYIREDHEGSFAAILGSDGTAYAKESFTPYGARRNTCTWSGPPTTGALAKTEMVSRREYTGATALGRMGLNDMKGRIQDAVTGRFLSADPALTRSYNTQSFNRYSYVLNNPLIYTDPSGFCIEISTTQGNPYPDVGPGPGCFTDPFYYTLPPLWSQNVFFGPGGGGGGGGGPGGPPLYHVPVQVPPPPPAIEVEEEMATVTVTARSSYSQCLATTLGALKGPSETSETLENTNRAHTAIEGTVESIVGADAVNVGRAFGPGPGPTAATNAATAAFGEQIQSALERAGPLLKGTGYVLGAASIANGYRTDGLLGASLATSDFAIESAMSSTVVGAGAAIAFNAAGGTRTLLEGQALQYCAGFLGVVGSL